MDTEKIARWAFAAFIIIAIIMGLVVGFMSYNNDPNEGSVRAYVVLILLILGVIVGLVSVTVKEVMPFLVAAIALIVAGLTNVWEPLSTVHPLLSAWATAILSFIIAFAAPAAVIVAIKAIVVITREK